MPFNFGIVPESVDDVDKKTSTQKCPVCQTWTRTEGLKAHMQYNTRCKTYRHTVDYIICARCGLKVRAKEFFDYHLTDMCLQKVDPCDSKLELKKLLDLKMKEKESTWEPRERGGRKHKKTDVLDWEHVIEEFGEYSAAETKKKKREEQAEESTKRRKEEEQEAKPKIVLKEGKRSIEYTGKPLYRQVPPPVSLTAETKTQAAGKDDKKRPKTPEKSRPRSQVLQSVPWKAGSAMVRLPQQRRPIISIPPPPPPLRTSASAAVAAKAPVSLALQPLAKAKLVPHVPQPKTPDEALAEAARTTRGKATPIEQAEAAAILLRTLRPCGILCSSKLLLVFP